MAPKKKLLLDLQFSPGDSVVYPTHGVGTVTAVQEQEIAGQKLDLYVIIFDRDRMTLRVPVTKVESSGLRKLSSKKEMDTAIQTLKGKARVKRSMWSRRAQEYDTKIFSGDPIKIAEVVRDLFRKNSQSEQSYSERQMFQVAIERLAREVAAVEKTDYFQSTEKIENILNSK